MEWKRLVEYPEQKVEKPSYRSTIIYWKIENGKIWHQWKKLMKADIESFEIYTNSDFIARDKDYIYNAWTKLSKVDRDTFCEVGDSYWKDKNYAYMEYETSIRPLKGLDVASFNYLENGYAYDKSFAYYFGKVIKSCNHPTTLEVIKENPYFAKDAENIYYEGAALRNVNIKAWSLLENSFSRDDKRIYFTARKLPKVDINTWEHIYRAYSKDKNNVYCMEQIQNDKNPNEWNKDKVISYYKEVEKLR